MLVQRDEHSAVLYVTAERLTQCSAICYFREMNTVQCYDILLQRDEHSAVL